MKTWTCWQASDQPSATCVSLHSDNLSSAWPPALLPTTIPVHSLHFTSVSVCVPATCSRKQTEREDLTPEICFSTCSLDLVQVCECNLLLRGSCSKLFTGLTHRNVGTELCLIVNTEGFAVCHTVWVADKCLGNAFQSSDSEQTFGLCWFWRQQLITWLTCLTKRCLWLRKLLSADGYMCKLTSLTYSHL